MEHLDAAALSSPVRIVVSGALPGLDDRLSGQLDTVNAIATPGVTAAQELTVQVVDADSDQVAG